MSNSTTACLFEVVSAYGTVGLSLGYPNINASLSAEFSVISKLVIIAMMIRGRHRGLPYALDRAIMLPSEALHRKEVEEATARLQRRTSRSGDITENPSVMASTATARQHNDGSTAPPGRTNHSYAGLSNAMENSVPAIPEKIKRRIFHSG